MDNSPKPPKTDQAPESQLPQEAVKPVKVKKPRSEAQQAATQKALAAMTAKRKQLNEEHREKKEEVKQAVKVVKEKILKDKVSFVTLQDFEATKRELAELRGMLTAKQQFEKERVVVPPKQERIVERVIERVPTPSQPVQKLTGTALLDSIFFNK